MNGVPSVPFNKVVVVEFEHWRGKYLSLSEKAEPVSTGEAERVGAENLGWLPRTS
jgi:hypothetical protein